LDPADLASRFGEAGRKAGFRIEAFGEAGDAPLLALTRRTPGPRPRVYLSAGIHGDEPAPPLALLRLVEGGFFDDRAVWFLCPLLNPCGLAKGTRENPAGLDLNRDYRHLESPEVRAHTRWLGRQPNFELAVCVHEDWEAVGYYLYELNPDGRRTLAETMTRAASGVCPIDRSPVIDGREAKEGIIRPLADPLSRAKWPEAIYLLANHTRQTYTVETPSALALETRVSAHAAALRAGLDLFLGP
jgi:hypothetical protein